MSKTRTPKVYLAASFTRQMEMREREADLRSVGAQCTSRWLYEEPALDPSGGLSDAERSKFATMDFDDVCRSHWLIFFSNEEGKPATNSGGRHVEFGIAYRSGCHIVVVGAKENIFHYLPDVVHVATFQDALKHITDREGLT